MLRAVYLNWLQLGDPKTKTSLSLPPESSMELGHFGVHHLRTARALLKASRSSQPELHLGIPDGTTSFRLANTYPRYQRHLATKIHQMYWNVLKYQMSQKESEHPQFSCINRLTPKMMKHRSSSGTSTFPSRHVMSLVPANRLRHEYHTDGYGVCLLIGPYHSKSMLTLDSKLPPNQKNTKYDLSFIIIGPKLSKKKKNKLTQQPLSQGAALLVAGHPPPAPARFCIGSMTWVPKKIQSRGHQLISFYLPGDECRPGWSMMKYENSISSAGTY